MFKFVAKCILSLGVLAAPAAWAANHVVTLSNFAFTPANLTINQGDTVTFKNNSGNHNVVADGKFRCATSCEGSGGNPSTSQWQATVTFSQTGTVQYYCEVHGSPGQGMAGTITVNATQPTFTITPGISGNWYNTAQDGHGFQLEVLKDAPTIVTAFWFVFDNNGNQVWINGVGTIDGNKVVMQAGRVLGGRFPPNFNPAQTTKPSWGTLTFTFTDCTHGHVDWTTTDPAFTPSGGLDIARLTAIAGSTCP